MHPLLLNVRQAIQRCQRNLGDLCASVHFIHNDYDGVIDDEHYQHLVLLVENLNRDLKMIEEAKKAYLRTHNLPLHNKEKHDSHIHEE